jgi:GTP-binding protein
VLKIALIGQPNVGKSSLFNRLAKKRLAIVSDISGTTRDIRRHKIKIDDRDALMLDTGGLSKSRNEIMEDGSEFKIFTNVKRKAIQTAKECDIILYMVDGKNIPDDDDKTLFYELQALGKILALVINKIDNDREKDRLWNFYSFGVDEEDMFGISVSHNRGTKRLFEWLYKQLPTTDKIEEKMKQQSYIDKNGYSSEEYVQKVVNNHIKVAIIGKVNVGKSSILNALIGEERSIVSEIAGTTIDPVDETIKIGEKKITFIDTAGLRRRDKIRGIEKFALMRTEDMLAQANLALIVLDASKPFTDQDEKISGLVDQFGLGTIIVLNKWDEKLETFKKLEEQIRGRFKFLYYAPIIAVSAKTGRGIHRLQIKLINIYDNFTQRVPTSLLNETIKKAIRKHSLPSPAGNMLKIYFATQFNTSPPTIAVIMNKPKLLHFSYKRYLINFLRDNISFEGTPIRLVARGKGERDDDEIDEIQYQVI